MLRKAVPRGGQAGGAQRQRGRRAASTLHVQVYNDYNHSLQISVHVPLPYSPVPCKLTGVTATDAPASRASSSNAGTAADSFLRRTTCGFDVCSQPISSSFLGHRHRGFKARRS
eukprot:7127784-Prymnesium_polylepis.2